MSGDQCDPLERGGHGDPGRPSPGLQTCEPPDYGLVVGKRGAIDPKCGGVAHGREVGPGIDVDAADVGAEIAGFTVRSYRPPGSG